jgi:hypothetical protein
MSCLMILNDSASIEFSVTFGRKKKGLDAKHCGWRQVIAGSWL